MIKTFYFNDLRTCCYVVYDETKKCAIIDPGCYSDSEKRRLEKFIVDNNLDPIMLINTHGHFDHIMGNAYVSKRWGVPTYMNSGDLSQIARSTSYGGYFGYEFEQPTENIIDLTDGMVLSIGDIKLEVFTSPGHSNGGVVLYNKGENYVITGDSLFAGSIGRTDLPGGDYDVLMESLYAKILPLPDETIVYPGHGPSTTISTEKGTNPFLHRV